MAKLATELRNKRHALQVLDKTIQVILAYKREFEFPRGEEPFSEFHKEMELLIADLKKVQRYIQRR